MSDEAVVQQVEEVGGDHLLQTFAQMAQETDLRMSITVHVRGEAIEGLLVSRDRWVEELVRLTSGARGDNPGVLGRGVAEAFRLIDLRPTTGAPIVYGYLHLQGAHIIGTLRQGEGFLWRGRISEVSAWSLG